MVDWCKLCSRRNLMDNLTCHWLMCACAFRMTISPHPQYQLLFTTGMNWFRNGLFRGSAWDWKQRDAQLTGNLKCVQSLTMAMQKLSILPFFCVWVPLLHPVSMDLNCYGCHETAITSFSFFQARRLFAANEASVSCIGGCSHRRSELKLVKVESATVPAVPKDSCVACWWRSRGWKPGTTAPQHVTWSSTEKDEEPGSAVPGDLLPSKSRAVGPEDVLMAMPTLSKCRWKEWSATHVRPHVGTKKERWREQIGSCGAEGRASQSLSKHIKWERVETEHAPIWGTDSRLISYRIEYYFILQCIFGKCLGICTPAHMMLTTCANWCTFHVSKVSLFHPLWRQGCPKIGWLVVNMDETDQLCPFWSQI